MTADNQANGNTSGSRPAEAMQPRLCAAASVFRLGLIGVILAIVAGTFAYLGGWLTPNKLTPPDLPTASSRVILI